MISMNIQMNVLRALNFSYYATNAVLIPFLPIYFIHKGFSPVEIGLLMMTGPFVAIFAQPMWGYISDRFNTVKMIIGLLWSMALLSSIGLFNAEGFTSSLLFSALLFFFTIPSTPLLDSIAIKSTMRIGKSYASVRLWGSIGFTLFAVLAGFLLDMIGEIESIRYMYWILWVIPVSLLFLLKDEKAEGPQVTLKALRVIVENKRFLWFLLLVFIIMVPHRMNDSLMSLYFTDLGGTDQMVGWAWALAGISEVPIFILVSRYMHRFHEMALLGVVAIMYMIRWLLQAMATDPWMLLFIQASHGITFAAFWIVAVQYAVTLVPSELRSTGQSLLSSVFLGVAGISGGIVGGWIKGEWGGTTMYYLAAGMALIAGLFFMATRIYYRKQDALRAAGSDLLEIER